MLYILFWLILYALSSLLHKVILFSWAQPIAIGLYTVFFLLWCFRSRDRRTIGLQLPQPRFWLYSLPTLVLPFWNLTLGWPTISATATCSLFAAVIEELFFRGFALQCIPWKNRIQGLYTVSAAFALFHFVNLGSADLAHTTVQVLFAFAAGLVFGGITLRSHSLLPAIAAHLFINLTATDQLTVGLWICVGIYLIYGIWLSQICNKEF